MMIIPQYQVNNKIPASDVNIHNFEIFTNYTFLIFPTALKSKSDLFFTLSALSLASIMERSMGLVLLNMSEFFYLVCPELGLNHGEVNGIGDDMVVVWVIPLGGKLHEDVPEGAALWVLNTMGSERLNCHAS